MLWDFTASPAVASVPAASNYFMGVCRRRRRDAGLSSVSGVSDEEAMRALDAMWPPRPADAPIPNSAMAWLCDAWRMHAQEQYGDAAMSIDRALEICPTSAKIHHFRGINLASAGHYEHAIAAFDHAAASDPARAIVGVEKAHALYSLHRCDEALALLQDAIKAEPDNAKFHYAMGCTLCELGQYDEALAAFERSEQICPTCSTCEGAGGMLRLHGRYDWALSFLARGVEMDPSSVHAHFEIGKTLSSMGNVEGALVALEHAASLDPHNLDVHFWIGMAMRALGRDLEALDAFTDAMYPENGGYPEPSVEEHALGELGHELQNAPGSAAAHANLGYALMELRAYSEALDALTHSALLNPNNQYVHYNRAQVLHKMGRLEEAVASLDRALEIDPEFAPAYSRLNYVLNDLGRADEARVARRMYNIKRRARQAP